MNKTLITCCLFSTAALANAGVVLFESPNIDGTDLVPTYTEDGVSFTATTGAVRWRDSAPIDLDPSTALGIQADSTGTDPGGDVGSLTFSDATSPFAFEELVVRGAATFSMISTITIEGSLPGGGTTGAVAFSPTAGQTLNSTDLAAFQNVTDITITAIGTGLDNIILEGLTTGPAVVPEPSTSLLAALAGLALIGRRRRR